MHAKATAFILFTAVYFVLPQECRLGMGSLSVELADIFAEDSGDEKTFYGFSEGELSGSDYPSSSESEGQGRLQSQNDGPPRRFNLKVALRIPAHRLKEEEEEEEEDEDEENRPPPTLPHAPNPMMSHSSSDSDQESHHGFLEKRAMNIKANKAMLAQLMADLHKMPGLLIPPQPAVRGAPSKPKRAPQSSAAGQGGARRNPERTSRRHTRSMGCADRTPSPDEQSALQRSIEDELLEVRGSPRQRRAPRPSTAIPHVIRPVEDITEEELGMIAVNGAEKTYNRATGSTCHQCRQKTIDTKTSCRNLECRGVQGQFCGPCLRNRYGEEVRDALLNPSWQCPPCREICNCSFCRQRDGRCPTGILFPLAQYHGFTDVHSYLLSLCNQIKTEDL
ncbi:cell division cycle-associated protein 7-like isoform X2 [Polyodon spathula]|uniref:cell division cycle-associated protein 7-like isoform X2 n=1 Tax=Polyodon spathula TaxID=7913 RepID=UPI001B7F6E82|nr:cell division cycle-associated protein 7-like isoform X2 [Polyodon spathula]